MPSMKNTELLKKTKDLLKDSRAIYFTDFTGNTVQKLEALRREIKKHEGNYLVAKNTLSMIALKELGIDEKLIKGLLSGPTGIAIAYGDPVILAKVLKSNEGIKIKGGIIEGEFYDVFGVLKLSEIPSKNVLLSELIGALNLLGNLVNVLQGILRNFVWTVDSLKGQKGP